jgi:hypothetical protein
MSIFYALGFINSQAFFSPPAGNAHRWLAEQRTKQHTSFMSVWVCD